jgi:primosomal protein N' (replication factor Y)
MSHSLFAADASEVARVALPLPVDGLFEYSVPPDLVAQAAPGCRALVRFGSRHLTGVIVERVREAEHPGELRPLLKLVDPEPVLSSALLDILREAAADVFCPLGVALAAALPAGSTPRIVRGFALTPRGRAALASGVVGEETRPLLAALEERPLPATALRARCGGAQVDLRLRDLEDDGLVERREVEGRPAARVARQRIAGLTPGVDVQDALARLARAPRQAALLRHLAESGETPLDALAKSFPPRLVRALSSRGLVAVHERAAPRDVLGIALEGDRSVTLSADQARALEPIERAIAAARPETFLLHGVTGSGKTEIYLRGVGAALRAGRQALVLVPEISLTHQIVARLRGRFGDELAVLHSGLRPGERLEQWQRLRAGATPIAVGARSALFAPLEKLGIIVIDEEHDGAYKNDEGFRYHARDLALRRAERAGCPLVLGSATPSLEVRFAADRGELRRLELPHRIGGRPLPAVEIVDLAREAERERRGRRPILSRPLRRAMAETLAAGGQTILFLNRRGFSTQVMCFECGHPERCPDCDVALVFHATEHVLRCHYCEHRIPPPDECRGCGAPGAALLGLGTQRLEEEVRIRFPEARIARLDRDTASRRGFTEGVLRDLRDRRIDILIGTQMVAKGHDFPGVRVVGVVAADIGLHMPDFRAAERTFQLLTQVAGRAGRDAAPGRVIVQTFVPNHYAIRPVRDHDYESFYVEELSHRAELGFPPFGRLAYVLVSSPELEVAMAAAQALALALDAAGAIGPRCTRMGPAPAPLARLRGRHRVQLLLRGEAEPVRRAAGILAAAIPGLEGDVQAALDVNPVHML